MSATPGWRGNVGRVAPAAAIVVVQLVLYPVPAGVWLQGAILGLLDALLAVGLALIYRANRILNFAQADLGTVPTVIAFGLIAFSGVGYVLGLLTGLATAIVLGALVEFLLIRRFAKSPRLILTVATIGLSQLLIVGGLLLPRLWGVDIFSDKTISVPFHISFTLSPLVFNGNHLIAVMLAPLSLAAVAIWLRATDVGVAVRAAAERSNRAAMLGIPVRRLGTVVWVVAAVLSYLGVFLRAGILGLPLSATLSLGALVAALAALALGGFDDFVGVGLAAIAIGVLEQGVTWNHPSNPTFVYFVFAVVVLAGLALRSTGWRRAARDLTASWQASAELRPVPRELRRLPEIRAGRLAGIAVLIAAAATLPLWLGQAEQLKAAGVAIYAIIALSIVVLTGWSGQVTLGQMAFAAVGAAVGALATSEWGLDLSLALLVAGACGALAAIVVGLPTLRLHGIFVAVTTLVFALATSGYLLNRSQFSWIPRERLTRPTLFGFIDLSSQATMFEVSLGCLVLALAAVHLIRGSRTGRALRAISSNDQAAEAYGVRTAGARIMAFAISGFLAGLAGCLLVELNQAYAEGPFTGLESLGIFTAAVVGGLATGGGAVIGALFLQGGRWFLPANWQLLPTALGVLAILLVLPGGLADLLYRGRDGLLRFVARRRDLVVPSLVADVRTEDAPVPEQLHDLMSDASGVAAGSGVAENGDEESRADRAGTAGSGPAEPEEPVQSGSTR